MAHQSGSATQREVENLVITGLSGELGEELEKRALGLPGGAVSLERSGAFHAERRFSSKALLRESSGFKGSPGRERVYPDVFRKSRVSDATASESARSMNSRE